MSWLCIFVCVSDARTYCVMCFLARLFSAAVPPLCNMCSSWFFFSVLRYFRSHRHRRRRSCCQCFVFAHRFCVWLQFAYAAYNFILFCICFCCFFSIYLYEESSCFQAVLFFVVVFVNAACCYCGFCDRNFSFFPCTRCSITVRVLYCECVRWMGKKREKRKKIAHISTKKWKHQNV